MQSIQFRIMDSGIMDEHELKKWWFMLVRGVTKSTNFSVLRITIKGSD